MVQIRLTFALGILPLIYACKNEVYFTKPQIAINNASVHYFAQYHPVGINFRHGEFLFTWPEHLNKGKKISHYFARVGFINNEAILRKTGTVNLNFSSRDITDYIPPQIYWNDKNYSILYINRSQPNSSLNLLQVSANDLKKNCSTVISNSAYPLKPESIRNKKDISLLWWNKRNSLNDKPIISRIDTCGKKLSLDLTLKLPTAPYLNKVALAKGEDQFGIIYSARKREQSPNKTSLTFFVANKEGRQIMTRNIRSHPSLKFSKNYQGNQNLRILYTNKHYHLLWYDSTQNRIKLIKLNPKGQIASGILEFNGISPEFVAYENSIIIAYYVAGQIYANVVDLKKNAIVKKVCVSCTDTDPNPLRALSSPNILKFNNRIAITWMGPFTLKSNQHTSDIFISFSTGNFQRVSQ